MFSFTLTYLFKRHAIKRIKDPINSGLAQFDHAQSNSKKWPKGYKDQMNKIFLVKTIIITFIYLLALFVVQN